MENIFKKNLFWICICIIISITVLSSAFILIKGFKETRLESRTISVTGSAKKQIRSDFIIWRSSFSTQSNQLSLSYKKLSSDLIKVKNYLKENGIDEKNISVLPIITIQNFEISPNGQMTSTIESYKLIQELEIRSSEVDKITNISKQATNLINEDIAFQSMPPQYLYTKISELKVDMLALATKDAKNRAEQIAINTNSKIKNTKSARMGVFQITTLYSTDVADYGIFDTSSIDKEITGIVNCIFNIE